MELVWLEDFLAVCRDRSFSRAAETRNVTQPAFSRRIRALEDWVGTPLFERSALGATPTAAGEVFATETQALHERILGLRARALEAARPVPEELRFAATQTLSFSFFPQWIRTIGDGGALGEVQLNSVSMAACEILMRQGKADFLLCHYHSAIAEPLGGILHSVPVGQDRIVAVHARGLDGGGAPLPNLAYSPESMLGRIVESEGERILPAQSARPVYRSHLAAALRSLALEGGGVAWLPASLVAADLESGRLVEAALEDIPVEIRLFRSTGALSPRAEAFWTEIEAADRERRATSDR